MFGCPGCGCRVDEGGDCACGDMLFDMRTRPGCEVLIDSDDAIRAKHLKRVHAIALGVSIVLAGPIGLLLMPIGGSSL